MRATLIRIEILRPGVRTFWFQPDSKIKFNPGQFIAITVPHTNVDSRGNWREFSISSSPSEPLLGITSSFAAQNSSTFKHALSSLKPGEGVFLGEPMGDFVLPKDVSISMVFVAAGIGSTPYASMIKWLLSRKEKRQIQFIYSASRPEEFIFNEIWRDYPLDFIPIVSRPNSHWQGATGQIDAKIISELAHPIGEKLIFLAGPQSLIESLFHSLLSVGIPRRQLLLDYFPGY
jgi:ferredoxin-NADP reductase